MLIVCANLSNLLLARATTRNKEMAVRAALGAGRRRLIRQMLTESTVLSAVGAALGLIIAIIGTRAISQMDAVSLPLLNNVHIDPMAVLFTVALAVVAGLAFGLTPALQIPESAMHDALKVSGRSTTDGKRGAWIRRTLVVSEIAMACMLLVGSGLLIRSFLKVMDVDLGFRPESIASVRVDFERSLNINSQEKYEGYINDVLRIAREIPGVKSAGISDGLPLAGNRSWGVAAKGMTYTRETYPEAYVRMASDSFITTLQMKIVEGRDFTANDVGKSDKVIVINQSMARRLFPGESAIGKFVKADTLRMVVGIVRDVHHLALEKDAGLEMYIPIRQTDDYQSLNLVMRTSLSPEILATTVRNALKTASPDLAVNQLQTLQSIVDKSVSPRRFFTQLLAVFATFALILALLGIYGVISYTVNNRTQEIGVRIALGASATQIQGRIIRETLGLAFIGMAIGTIGSYLLTRTLSTFLFGITGSDPVTFGTMLVTVTAVAILSGYLPARRASRIDPVIAFRST